MTFIKGVIFYIALCILLLSPEIFGVEVNTGNLLNNSTFGTGTTYSTDNWTVSEGTHGHNYMSSGGANGPGGAVAAEENTVIEQTINSLATAGSMTVPEIQKGWSSTMSSDIWFWNTTTNTITLKQTITDSEGNVSTQQRIIEDTGCGSINCGQFTNYTDKHIQGANSSTDFSIKVGVHNTNNASGHWGPDIDDVQLNVTYTDVPPIDTVVEEELNNLPDEDDWTFDENLEDFQPDFEDEFVFEDDFEWEEDFYFEEEFDMEEYMTVDFEDQWVDMEEMDFEDEFVEMNFEEMNMDMEPEMVFEDDFINTDMEMTGFDDVYMEDFEEFEEFEDAWGMEPEMELTEMDTFFNEMSDDEWEDFEEMSEDEFTEFLEEEFPEDFTAMREEMDMEEMPTEEPEMIMEEEMNEPEPEMEVASNEDDDMMKEEPEPEMKEPENEEVQNEKPKESTEEPKENVEEESEDKDSPSEVVENEDEKSEPDSEDVADAEVQAESDTKQEIVQKAEIKENRKISIEDIKVDKVKINVEKITLFSDQGTLETYEAVSFYQPEQIYTDVDTSFFDQIDMVEYNKQIYQNISLASYTNNDPVEIHRKNVERIYMEKQRLLIELQQLKGQQ